ncbi:hypothetical protein C942_04893 [Photobacterium marinum]|uniref:Uncharacterized protein n=1 Tax=Photobacterium marinum TaxID=1056511 RepID=L8JBN8_9GAMM|nr:hypothetical protein [Photobacterium marinum]ELR66231.1 hypothetical protein C942_04893 [Photobacterium marinum]
MSRLWLVIKALLSPVQGEVKNKRKVIYSEELPDFIKKDLGLY